MSSVLTGTGLTSSWELINIDGTNIINTRKKLEILDNLFDLIDYQKNFDELSTNKPILSFNYYL